MIASTLPELPWKEVGTDLEQNTVSTYCGLLLKVHQDCKAKQNPAEE